jgi:hypothetical protein
MVRPSIIDSSPTERGMQSQWDDDDSPTVPELQMGEDLAVFDEDWERESVYALNRNTMNRS